VLKANWKPGSEIKNTVYYVVFFYLVTFLPLIAIIIGGYVAWSITTKPQPTDIEQFYADNLSIVGVMPVGLDGLLYVPKISHPFGNFLGAVFPLTLISFMESFAVARRLATDRNELHILSENQVGCR
jgi:hypothetical protein